VDLNQQKQQFSIAYVRAVAAVAGYNVYKQEVDDESVDLGIAATGVNGTTRNPRLELQLKCSERIALEDQDFGFWLKLKNYDDLRDSDLHVPKLLLVVHVPVTLDDWIAQDEKFARDETMWILAFPGGSSGFGQRNRLHRPDFTGKTF